MKFKFKNSKLFKLKYLIVFTISILFGFYLYTIPSINYKFLNLSNNKHSKNLINKTSDNKNTEILFSPFIIDSPLSNLDFSDFDATLGIPLKENDIDLLKLNFLPNVLIKGNSKVINNTEKVSLIDNENFSKINILDNSIVFMYLDKDLSDSTSISSYSKMINEYKDKNYFIILYIKPKTQITSNALNFLCNQGVNLIFSPSISNTYIEKCNNSIIIYGVESNSYIPQFDIVFNNNKPIALGVRFISENTISDNNIKEIEKRSNNVPFKISNIFSFFDY